MQLGLKLNESDNIGATPLYYLFRGSADPESVVALFLFLHSKDLLDDAVEELFIPSLKSRRESSLHRLIWAVPGLFQAVVGHLQPDFSSLPPASQFASLSWEYADPQVLLDIIRQDRSMSPERFRSSLHNAVESLSIASRRLISRRLISRTVPKVEREFQT